MKAKINGISVEGTPEEIFQIMVFNLSSIFSDFKIIRNDFMVYVEDNNFRVLRIEVLYGLLKTRPIGIYNSMIKAIENWSTSEEETVVILAHNGYNETVKGT